MAILIDETTRVLVQGITGRAGSLQAKVMMEHGTNIVAGVTPGKGGRAVEGVPVYDTVAEAVAVTPVDAAIAFVPPAAARESCLEIIDAGISFLVLTTEGIPQRDVISILRYAQIKGTRILGPGTAGVISPGRCKLGTHPDRMFLRGRVGVVSKSGALSYEIAKTLTEHGIGQSTVAGIGGGPVWGLTTRDIVELFQQDPDTDAIVLLGEIGGDLEQQAADFIRERVTKPVVAMIVGRAAPKGKSLGHAGAIIEGNRGTAEDKIRCLRQAGATIALTPAQLAAQLQTIMQGGTT